MIDATEPLAGISFAQRPPPPFILEIPADRGLDAFIESDLCLLAELLAQASRVDGITGIMAGPIRHERYQLPV